MVDKNFRPRKIFRHLRACLNFYDFREKKLLWPRDVKSSFETKRTRAAFQIEFPSRFKIGIKWIVIAISSLFTKLFRLSTIVRCHWYNYALRNVLHDEMTTHDHLRINVRRNSGQRSLLNRLSVGRATD